ncbi:MAG: hypothetical protein AAF685_10475 [Cyanobacteria bacterium P01_C01_bin.89]
MKITQNSTTARVDGRSLIATGKTVPHPMDPQGSCDREMIMVWRATGESYPKMEAHWVYRDEL